MHLEQASAAQETAEGVERALEVRRSKDTPCCFHCIRNTLVQQRNLSVFTYRLRQAQS